MLVRLLDRDSLLLLTTALKHCIKDYIRLYLSMILGPVNNGIPALHGTGYQTVCIYLITHKGRVRLSDDLYERSLGYDLKRFSDLSYSSRHPGFGRL